MSDEAKDNRGRLWNEAHDQLKISMQKEIGIMREILGNMHQEELSLLLNDKGSWNHVMQERSQLIERLSYLRAERLEATKKIEDMVDIKDKTKEIPLESILPTQDENSCEILSLRDQLMALMERINFQGCRNEILFHQVEHQPDIPYNPQYNQNQPAPAKSKKKASIATYNFKL
ncbi:MAG TPA: hypothetical protein VLG49_04940 [Rhabdochlamydiaceae bacterium]|nr:hypothetical protein [Rhabdochlamydiaceae bacterium]